MYIANLLQPKAQALFHAIRHGDLNFIEKALSNGYDKKVRNTSGDTLLTAAAISYASQFTEFLLSVGCDANEQDSAGLTPLLLATRIGILANVKLLVAAKADLEVKCEEGLTALQWAIGYGLPKITEVLLAAGANLETTDPHHRTPLLISFVAKPFRFEVVNMLIKYGANPLVLDSNNRSAMENHPEFFTRDNLIKIFIEAAIENDHKSLHNLLKNYAEIMFPEKKEPLQEEIKREIIENIKNFIW
jgi:ankyrin repeat protein